MEILPLIFSGPGATICVCITVLILVIVYLIFSDKFMGLSLGYKEFKVETPKPLGLAVEPPVEAILDSKESVEPKALDANGHPFKALFDAAAKQDRAGIEAAIEKMRNDPPFGFSALELETFKFSELLDAGFTDAIENLKIIEGNQTNQIQASLSLAKYYFGTRTDVEAERHLKIAEGRAHTDDKKVDIMLLRAEIMEFTKGKQAAITFLDEHVNNVGDDKQRFRLLNEIGNLSNATGDKAKAIVAYEQALRCMPENIETRFKLALIYGAIAPLKLLGMRHYRIIYQQNHLHAGALHNLGLLYGEFGLQNAKINLIKRAADQNDGHSLGSLAHFYIENGFIDDAQEIIDRASKETALSERLITAQQYLRRSEQENDVNRQKLIRAAEELSSIVSNHEFPKRFDANKYVGGWIATKEENSTLHINSLGGYGQFKFIIESEDRKIFGYTYLSSAIAHVDFSKVDKQPLGLLSVSEGEIKVAILFGEDTLCVIEPEGLRIRSSREYRRATI